MSGKGSGYRAMDWAWKLVMPPTNKLVMVNLAGRCDQAYSCWPSIRLIASETQLHRTSVVRAIDWLEANDLLIRATRLRPNGSKSASRYFLNHPEAPHVTGDFDPEDDPVMAEQIHQAAARAISRGVATEGGSSSVRPGGSSSVLPPPVAGCDQGGSSVRPPYEPPIEPSPANHPATQNRVDPIRGTSRGSTGSRDRDSGVGG